MNPTTTETEPARATPRGWFETAATSSETEPAADTVTYVDAIRAALEDELRDDDRVVLLGEDIGAMGGAFRATDGLHTTFGDDGVIDTPIAETAIVGAGIGLAVMSKRPVVELQFADFISCTYDTGHRSSQAPLPLRSRRPARRASTGRRRRRRRPVPLAEPRRRHIPGLKVGCPGDVQDADDLLRAAIADPNPVLFFEHKALYRALRAPLTRGAGRARLGEAAVRPAGTPDPGWFPA